MFSRKTNKDLRADKDAKMHFQRSTIRIGNLDNQFVSEKLVDGFREHFIQSLYKLTEMENAARITIGIKLRQLDWQNEQLTADNLLKIIWEAFLEARIPYSESPISNTVVIQQLQRFFIGNLKTIVKNHFERVLLKRFRRMLGIRGNDKCRPLWFLLKLVLGSVGSWKDEGNDEDEDEDEDECDDFFEETVDEPGDLEVYSMETFLKGLKDMNKKSKLERQVIDSLALYSDIDSVRQVFLPAFLLHIVGDQSKGYRAKLKYDKNYLPLVLRLFGTENSELVLNPATNELEPVFLQQLTPQANVRARSQRITTTILACIWCDYIKTHENFAIDVQKCMFSFILDND